MSDIAGALGFLLGSFAGVEETPPSAWTAGGRSDATAHGELAVGGRVLVQRQTQHTGGAETFAAHNVFTTDPQTGEIVSYSFDSVGFLPEPPARGTMADGLLRLERTTERGSSLAVYRPLVAAFEWSKSFRVRPEDPWQLVVSGLLRVVPDR